MDDETLDHLHAYVRREYLSRSVEAVYATIVRFLEAQDEVDRAYFIDRGWRFVDEHCAQQIGEALLLADGLSPASGAEGGAR